MTIIADLINGTIDMTVMVLFNGGPLDCVSQAVIYITSRSMGDFTGLKQNSNKGSEMGREREQ